jgi:DNA polymerase-4
LRKRSELELVQRFGKFGCALHQLCRGIDDRPVNPKRERKSLSNERTFRHNLTSIDEGLEKLDELIVELHQDLAKRPDERPIRECVVKVKFEDFQITSAQRASEQVDADLLRGLLCEAWERGDGKGVRLIGAGVRFHPEDKMAGMQLEMF